MAKIICPNCKTKFDQNNPKSLVTRTVAAAAMGGTGATLGSSVGLAAGPIGAISGTIPGLVIGAGIGWFAADQFRKCPKCGKVFKT